MFFIIMEKDADVYCLFCMNYTVIFIYGVFAMPQMQLYIGDRIGLVAFTGEQGYTIKK